MKIILISGKAEAGKTTAAKFLKEYLESRGEHVAITPYGQLVKDLCKMLYGWNGQKDEAGRQLLQHFGTDVVRAVRPDYWVDHIIELSCLLYNEFDTFIIDDSRFRMKSKLGRNMLNGLKGGLESITIFTGSASKDPDTKTI